MYPDGHMVKIKAAMSCIIADHVQACYNCEHMGNNAEKNCRYCMASKAQRTDVDLPILEWRMTRTNDQSVEFVKQMHAAMGPNPTDNKRADTCYEYGIREKTPLFFGTIDAHQQSLICIGHLINLGLLSRLIDEMIAQVLSNGTLDVVEARLDSFNYPPGWTRLTTKVLLLKGRKMKPMAVALKIGLMSDHLFQGLVDPYLLLLTRSLLKVNSSIMNPHHTDDSIATTQREGKEWITAAVTYANTRNRNLLMDVPNMHLLLELLMRVLPMIRDVRAGSSSRYESQIQVHKDLVKRTRFNVGAKPENFALTQHAYSEGIRLMIRCGRWGPNLEFSIGPALAAMLRCEKANPYKPPSWLRSSLSPLVPRAVQVS